MSNFIFDNSIKPVKLHTDSVNDVLNYNIAASTDAGNNLIVSLKTSSGLDPSSRDPVILNFRGKNGAGSYTRTINAPLSITVQSGSTLGVYATYNTYIYVYLTILGDLAVSRTMLKDHTDTVTILAVAGTGADSNTAFYGNTAISTYVTVIGRLETTLATSGVWNAAVTSRPYKFDTDFFAMYLSNYSNTSIATNNSYFTMPFPSLTGMEADTLQSSWNNSTYTLTAPKNFIGLVSARIYILATNVIAGDISYQMYLNVNGSNTGLFLDAISIPVAARGFMLKVSIVLPFYSTYTYKLMFYGMPNNSALPITCGAANFSILEVGRRW